MVTGQHLALLGGKQFSDFAIYEVFMALILKQQPDAGQTHCIFQTYPNDTGRKYKEMPTEVSLFFNRNELVFSLIFYPPIKFNTLKNGWGKKDKKQTSKPTDPIKRS